ncbi:protein spaetzle 4-like isoform X1 [Tigriopus californicus]|uniref:protein spaetzle 4-like isoform X1 n=1 Tax=Tigriopus californicus TaxID=6832 RepID=UPI0027DA9347|nr:protein spaetzle 4-like isoform X1 [Tigriopus californicus]XP_059096918.1 protein spaetzle 4-like isoform X1 [Tigriopus californicus]
MFFPRTLVLVSLCGLATPSVDEFMSCDRFFENKRASRVLEQIPCDMSKQSFCAYKGAAYPEAAIWQFKEDNRGLMKRLYGDLESASLYREMRSVNLPSASNIPSLEHNVFSSLEYNIRVGSGLATVQSAREPVLNTDEEPAHEVPVKNAPFEKEAAPVLEVLEDLEDLDGPIEMAVHVEPGIQAPRQEPVADQTTQVLSFYDEEPTTTETSEDLMTTSTTDYDTDPSTLIPDDFEERQLPNDITTLPTPHTTNTVVLKDNETIDATAATGLEPMVFTEPDLAMVDDHFSPSPMVKSSVSQSQPVTFPTPPPTSTSSVTSATPTVLTKPTTGSTSSPMSENVLSASLSEMLADVDLDSLEQIVGELLPNAHEQTQPVAQVGPSESAEAVHGDVHHPPIKPVLVDQASEDTLESGSMDEYDFSGPSINACPVKEEVVAPYWANNTRNQVLALLNLYPFEQYIHMETCKFENEQMMCRDGCRCEQQYRLHRLLAFDSNNECRGIFSDWFRFPSYCICKCYGFPHDFAGGQRNPRREPKQSPAKEPVQPTVRAKSTPTIPQKPRQEPHRHIQKPRDHRRLNLGQKIIENEDFNSVEHEPRALNGFFYATAPVLEYQKPQGHSVLKGVNQTPRK